jgi:hypothetical protein
MPTFGRTMLLVLAMRMAAIFVFSTTTIARGSGVLPRWFIVAGYVVGVFLLLSVTLSPILIVVFPAWVIVLCVLLIQRARQIPGDLTLGDVAPDRGLRNVASSRSSGG